MIKEKTEKQFKEWLNENSDRPFYVIGEKHWDEGNEYYLCAFNLTEEDAHKIKDILWKTYVETEPFGFIEVKDSRKDKSFFEKHKDFQFDLHKFHGNNLVSYN